MTKFLNTQRLFVIRITKQLNQNETNFDKREQYLFSIRRIQATYAGCRDVPVRLPRSGI